MRFPATDRFPTSLSKHEVAVWHTRLDRFNSCLPCLHEWLDEETQQRANQFHSLQERRRFLVAHGLLNLLLSHYLSLEPASLPFRRLPNGKPFLAPDQNRIGLQFSFSRSQDVAVYALARHRAVGVDVESLAALPFDPRVCARFFSPDERTHIAALPPAEQHHACLQLWTEKEALVKGSGEGLAALISPRLEALHTRWRVTRLDLGPDAYASVAAPCGKWFVSCREWWLEDCGTMCYSR